MIGSLKVESGKKREMLKYSENVTVNENLLRNIKSTT